MKFCLKVILASIVSIFLGLFALDCYFKHVEKVKVDKLRAQMIEKFGSKKITQNEEETEPQETLVKVSLKLESILLEEPQDEKNIFFIDSSHVLGDPPKTLNSRQLCSFESAGSNIV
jgi:hypothetical protein